MPESPDREVTGNSRGWLIRICTYAVRLGIIALGCALFLSCTYHDKVVDWIVRNAILRPNPGIVAQYDSMAFFSFNRSTGEFHKLTINGGGDGVDLCVKWPDGTVVQMRAVTAQEFIETLHAIEGSNPDYYYGDDGLLTVTYLDSFAAFRHGQLSSFVIFVNSPLEFSNNRDGPFLKLPAKQELVIGIFGEPLEWRRIPQLGP